MHDILCDTDVFKTEAKEKLENELTTMKEIIDLLKAGGGDVEQLKIDVANKEATIQTLTTGKVKTHVIFILSTNVFKITELKHANVEGAIIKQTLETQIGILSATLQAKITEFDTEKQTQIDILSTKVLSDLS